MPHPWQRRREGILRSHDCRDISIHEALVEGFDIDTIREQLYALELPHPTT
jgi:hypothetical protein